MAFDWEPACVIKINRIRGMINRAILGNGNVFYSIKIARAAEDSSDEEKMFQYLRPEDLASLPELSREAEKWIADDTLRVRSDR